MQPQVSRPKFRLETNSTVVWLYVGGVSLILPDVRFGTVALTYLLCVSMVALVRESQAQKYLQINAKPLL